MIMLIVVMFSMNSDVPVKQWDEKPNITTSWNGSNDNSVLESLLSKKSQGRILLCMHGARFLLCAVCL